MKPDWDKLMKEFKDSKDVLIADVDCTTGGKSLCESVGVRGYPSIKYGDPNNLEDYKGGRSLSELQKFAKENLGPTCGPSNLDLCDAEKKAQIEKFMAMSASELDATITEKDAESAKLDSDLQAFLKGLQSQYEEAQKKKEEAETAIKDSGLGLMKAVKASKKSKTEL